MITETIPAALDGERLDRVVALIADLTRSDAAQLILSGGVAVDGRLDVAGKARLRAGQEVAIDVAALARTDELLPDDTVQLTVHYEDDDIIVIDKPAGLVVHPGSGHGEHTLVNGLLARYPEIATVGERHRPGIVHRLDAGTSGLLAVARSQRAYDALVRLLADRDVTRVYQALVWGHPQPPTGIIDAPVGRDHRDPTRMAVVVDGRPARTRYRVVQNFARPAAVAELRCRLETGRTHQIRVHLAAIAHPVVGDTIYGGARQGIDIARPFLHAAELAFDHPFSGARLGFRSELPQDLQRVRDRLEP